MCSIAKSPSEPSTSHASSRRYTDETGAGHPDNAMRFRLLSLAALEAPLQLPLGGAIYGEDIFLVANDWQTALVSPLRPLHR